MGSHGHGYCSSGYYAGWDGLGDASEEACKNLCMKEDQCTFAAYYNGDSGKTCSRYNTKKCLLYISTVLQRGHWTFRKEGLYLKIKLIH